MILIDSSLWYEYYEGSKYSFYVEKIIKNMGNVLVPTIIIVEIFKKLITVTNQDNALKFIAQMKKGEISDLDFDLSLIAAFWGKEYKLPLADSIIYATALKFNAEIYTLDKHFKGLKNVKYFEKLN